MDEKQMRRLQQRRHNIVSVLLMVALVFSTSGSRVIAQTVDNAPWETTTAVAAATSTIRADSLKGDIYFFASEPLRGRATGTRGDHIAIAYIASRFMRMGLKPMGDDGTYFQNLTVLWGKVDPTHTALTASIKGVKHEFVLGKEFRWAHQSLHDQTGCGEVVFAGYGIDAPEYQYSDFRNFDVRGKVAIVLAGEPPTSGPKAKFMGEWPTWHAFVREKIEVLRERGAAGILIVSNPGRHRTLPIPPSSPRAPGIPLMALKGQMWSTPTFYITRTVADQLLAPSGKTIDALESKIDTLLQPESFVLPQDSACLTRAYTDVTSHPAQNVVALLPGSDAALRAQTVLVTAHHDHMGVEDGHTYYGADDDGSGVAAVLEVAHAFVTSGIRPKRSILFMTFDGEERLWLGSYYYMHHPVVPLADTIADINVDMIGRNEDDPNWPVPPDRNVDMVNVLGTRYNPALSRAIADQNHATGLVLDHKMDRVSPDVLWARADQFWFATRGVPQVEFQTGLHPDYHTDNDTWYRINYPKLTRITRLIFLTVDDLTRSDIKIPFVAAGSTVQEAAAGGPWDIQPLWPLRAASHSDGRE